MGWKSTRTISRSKAISKILSILNECSDEELADALESLGFGDNTDLPYYGNNFIIGEEDN